MLVLTQKGKELALATWTRAESVVKSRLAELPNDARLVVRRLLTQNPVLAERAIEALDAGHTLERIAEIVG